MLKSLLILTLFRVAFVGDPQADNATQVSYAQRSLFRELRERKDVDLVVVLGDLVNDESGLIGPMAASLDSLPCPWVAVPGNHDRDVYRGEKGRARDVATWRRELGYVDTAFVRNGVKFILMNDVRTKGTADYEAGFSESQKAWLAAELAATPSSQTAVLATHIPLTEMHARDTLAALLGGHGKLLLVSGHTHQVRRETLVLPRRRGASEDLTTDSSPAISHDGGPSMIIRRHDQVTPVIPFNLPETTVSQIDGIKIESLVVGATCGSWWRGFKDAIGIPDALMNCGSPRGYFIADFDLHGYSLSWHTLTCGETLNSPSVTAAGSSASTASRATAASTDSGTDTSNIPDSYSASSLSDKLQSIKEKLFSLYNEDSQVSVSATDSTLVVNVFGGHIDGKVRVKGVKLPKHVTGSLNTDPVRKRQWLKLSRKNLIAPEVEERIAFNSLMTREYRREHQEEYIPMRRLASPHVWSVDLRDISSDRTSHQDCSHSLASSLRGQKVTVIYTDDHMSFRVRAVVR